MGYIPALCFHPKKAFSQILVNVGQQRNTLYILKRLQSVEAVGTWAPGNLRTRVHVAKTDIPRISGGRLHRPLPVQYLLVYAFRK